MKSLVSGDIQKGVLFEGVGLVPISPDPCDDSSLTDLLFIDFWRFDDFDMYFITSLI